MQNNLINYLIIFGAKYLIFILMACAIWYFWKLDNLKRKEIAIFGLITMPLAYLVLWLISLFYNDQRPFMIGNFTPLIPHGPDNGFPSDHAALSSAIAMTVFYFNRKLGIGLLTLSLIISLSRVLAGVHHLTDVFGSIFSSVIISSFVFYVLWPNMLSKLNK
ncbi:MAG: phosphatase PAP2 family protein [bacterium]